MRTALPVLVPSVDPASMGRGTLPPPKNQVPKPRRKRAPSVRPTCTDKRPRKQEMPGQNSTLSAPAKLRLTQGGREKDTEGQNSYLAGLPLPSTHGMRDESPTLGPRLAGTAAACGGVPGPRAQRQTALFGSARTFVQPEMKPIISTDRAATSRPEAG